MACGGCRQEPPGVESDPAQCGAQGWVRGSDLKEVKESTPEREPPTDGSVAEALTVSLGCNEHWRLEDLDIYDDLS